jgi:hypothetical protein
MLDARVRNWHFSDLAQCPLLRGLTRHCGASIAYVSGQAISRNQPPSRSRIQLIGTVTDQPPKIPKPIVALQSSTIFTVPRSACSPKITTSTLSSCVISNPSFPNGTNYSSSVGSPCCCCCGCWTDNGVGAPCSRLSACFRSVAASVFNA